MIYYFTPPTAPSVPAAVRPSHQGYALFRHYRPWEAGINLWLLDDDTVTESEPYGDEGVARAFLGSHLYEIDDREAALLSAAGYTVPGYLGVPPMTSDPSAPYGYGTRRYNQGSYGGAA